MTESARPMSSHASEAGAGARAAAARRILLSPPQVCGRERDHIEAALAADFITPLGPQLDGFERDFAAICGMAECCAVSSGTAALHLVLRALGVGPGDAVWAPTLTFIGGVAPIRYLGAEPVFFDVGADHWTLDADLLADELARAAREGGLPAAVVPCDLYGQSADLDSLLAVCGAHGVPVVMDSAESVGARYKDRHAGAGARAAIYSFNGNKIVTSAGGGMIASDDAELVARCRYLATQARQPVPWYEHEEIGYNYRLSNICAAVGRGQLEILEARVARRREIFESYAARLADLPGLAMMPEAPWGRANRWLTVITLDPDRARTTPEALRRALESENIEARPVWKPMHLQPALAGARRVGGAVAERLWQTGLCLPSGGAMTEGDIERVTAVIRGLAA